MKTALEKGGLNFTGHIFGGAMFDQNSPFDDLGFSSTVTMSMLNNFAQKALMDTATDFASDSIPDDANRSSMLYVPTIGNLACISTDFSAINLNYITENVFRRA